MVIPKTERIAKELVELETKNLRLHELLQELEEYAKLKFNKDVVVTSVFRTKEEHDTLYAKTDPSKRPISSPHCVWAALDLRSHTFSDTEIRMLVDYLNDKYTYKDGKKKVAMCHAIAGGSSHFHIQYV